MAAYIKQFRSPRGCLSYFVCDEDAKECLVIDPSEEVGQGYENYLAEEHFRLRYIVETHTHADHISSAPHLKASTGSSILRHRSAPSAQKDIGLKEGDTIIVGALALRVIETPGHTSDSISFLLKHAVFTGDTLLIHSTGRTDFQQGSSEQLYKSLWEKLIPLGEDIIVYPAHDYKDRDATTIGAEKLDNPRLKMSREEFITAMNQYHPPKPDLFDEAIEKNSA